MKKLLLIAFPVLVAFMTLGCDGLLTTTPGQPPLIAGIEVSGSSDNLFVLVGADGQLGIPTALAWAGAGFDDYKVGNKDYAMQVVGGKGSIDWSAAPKTLKLEGGFKLRVISGWQEQIGIDGTGNEGDNFSFDKLKANFDGKTYVIVLKVLRGVGGKMFASATLEERKTVAKPNPTTGAVVAGPAATYVKIGSITLTGVTETEKYFITGTDGAMVKDDKGAYIVGDFQRFASATNTGVGKDFVIEDPDTAVVGSTFKKTFETKKDSYTVAGVKSEVTFPTPYLAKKGAKIRIDTPFGGAAGTALEFTETSLADQLGRNFTFLETPNRVYSLTYNVTTGVWTATTPSVTTGFTLGKLHFGKTAAADLPAGVTFANTAGAAGSATRVKLAVTVNNFFGTQVLGLKGKQTWYADATTATGSGDWDGTVGRGATVAGTKTITAWFVPGTVGDWGWTTGDATANAFCIGAETTAGGSLSELIIGTGNSNMPLDAIGGDSVVITIDADIP